MGAIGYFTPKEVMRFDVGISSYDVRYAKLRAAGALKRGMR